MAKRQGKSPVRWFGGKYRLAPHIVDLFPPHRIYVEVFGGGGSVLFAKEPSVVEVYNDLDEGVSNFFAVIRDETSCAILAKRLAATPYSRADYYDCLKSWSHVTDSIEKARQWFVIMRMSFGGMFGNAWGFGRSGEKQSMTTSAWLGAQRLILEAQERLALVQIENRDFRKIISLYDTPETLFYLDPPYVPDTRKEGKYRCELTAVDHHDLVQLILSMQGQVILSGTFEVGGSPSTQGLVAGAIWAVVDQQRPGCVVPVTDRQWQVSRADKLAARQTVAAMYPTYNAHQDADGNVADAINLARWWLSK